MSLDQICRVNDVEDEVTVGDVVLGEIWGRGRRVWKEVTCLLLSVEMRLFYMWVNL